METNEKNSKTALLVMDIQSTIISYLPDPAPLLSNIEKAAKAAHLAGIKVIYYKWVTCAGGG